MAQSRRFQAQLPLSERYHERRQAEAREQEREAERVRQERAALARYEIGGVPGLDPPRSPTEHESPSSEAQSTYSSDSSEVIDRDNFPEAQWPQPYPTPPPSESGTDRDITLLQERVRKKDATILSLRRSLDAERLKVNQLSTEKREIQEAYDQAFIEDQQEQCLQSQRQLENAMTRLRQARDEIRNLEGQVSKREQEKWELEQRLQRAQRENLDLESRLQEPRSLNEQRQGQPNVAPAVSLTMAFNGNRYSLQPYSNRAPAVDGNGIQDRQSFEVASNHLWMTNGRNQEDLSCHRESGRGHHRRGFTSVPKGEAGWLRLWHP